MARGNDRGKDFDDQFHQSKRRGQEKARRGESHWAEDKYLERNNERLSRQSASHGKRESCADKTVLLLATLGGVAWGLSEAVSRIV